MKQVMAVLIIVTVILAGAFFWDSYLSGSEPPGLKIVVEGSNDFYNVEEALTNTLNVNEREKITVPYDLKTYGIIRKIYLLPKVLDGEDLEICNEGIPLNSSKVIESPSMICI